jgi:hypothetical protein
VSSSVPAAIPTTRVRRCEAEEEGGLLIRLYRFTLPNGEETLSLEPHPSFARKSSTDEGDGLVVVAWKVRRFKSSTIQVTSW